MPATGSESSETDPAIDRLAREIAHFESVLPGFEKNAAADVSFSYVIRRRDRREWDRMADILESLARLRLRLAAAMSLPDRLTPQSRRLLRKAGTIRRLESASDRLEVLEDLYEGAVDRINDHRYWRDGHVLEIIIILFLALEAILIGIELYTRYKEMS